MRSERESGQSGSLFGTDSPASSGYAFRGLAVCARSGLGMLVHPLPSCISTLIIRCESWGDDEEAEPLGIRGHSGMSVHHRRRHGARGESRFLDQYSRRRADRRFDACGLRVGYPECLGDDAVAVSVSDAVAIAVSVRAEVVGCSRDDRGGRCGAHDSPHVGCENVRRPGSVPGPGDCLHTRSGTDAADGPIARQLIRRYH